MNDSRGQRIRGRTPTKSSAIRAREILAVLRELVRPTVSPMARRFPYRGRAKTLRVLGPDLASMSTWSAVETDLHGEMAEIFSRTPRVHKLAHYFSVYESVVDRSRPIRMLEICGFHGGSLQMWREYLHPDSRIVSVDIDSKLLKVGGSDGIHVRIGDERGAPFLTELAAEFGPFDVILDEGSHTSSHMVDSFRCLFADALHEGGLYIVEDVHCDYWTFYRDSRISFMDLVKALIDAMHGHYQVASGETNFRVGHPDRLLEVVVPAVTPILGGIEIYDSIVIVRRATRDLTRSIYRS